MKKENGITLIALVITITILLILAGISIATLTGENGLLSKANTAKEEHKIAQYKEELELIIAGEVTERTLEAKEGQMIKSLYDQINSKDVEWVDNRYMCNEEGIEKENVVENRYLIVESKEGYEFIIEVDEPNNVAKIISVDKISGEAYKIKYDLNGGEGEPPITKEIRKGFSIILAKNTGTKGGAKFLGWCEDKEGKGTLLEEDKPFKPTGEEEQVILYAIWSKPPEGSNTASRSPKELTYDWSTLGEMANVISEAEGINQSIVEVVINNESLLVGDWIVIKYGPQEIAKKARIIGFNHDILASDSNKTAGISFEFVTIIESGPINSSGGTSGGWGACEMRGKLEEQYFNKLPNPLQREIKTVSKKYIEPSATEANTSNDRLWLLANSEVFRTNVEGTRYSFYTKGGSCIKYTTFTEGTDTGEQNCWFRSAGKTYWYKNYGNDGDMNVSSRSYGIAPGFCI